MLKGFFSLSTYLGVVIKLIFSKHFPKGKYKRGSLSCVLHDKPKPRQSFESKYTLNGSSNFENIVKSNT
jgi:hypothetical protein